MLDLILPPRLLLAARKPRHLLRSNTVLVLQNSPCPNRHGDLVFGDTDALASHIRGLPDSGIRININAGVAKGPRRENRDRDEFRKALFTRYKIGAHREFGGVELLIAKHPPESFLDAERQIS